MKKLMMLVCLLGLATMAYAESPAVAVRIMDPNFGNPSQHSSAPSVQKQQVSSGTNISTVVIAGTVAVISKIAHQSELQAQANNEAQQAEDKLDELIKYNENFKVGLQVIKAKHAKLVEVISHTSNRKQVLKEANVVLEDLIQTTMKLNYQPLVEKVVEALDHPYYFPLRNPDKLISLPKQARLACTVQKTK
ncbi:MAG: hypothetical protein IKN49_00800 [Elusimicrobiaceae bacterium]|nr:hypothetical protein [Elusimicrobiaceae bacterium]